MKHLFIVCCLVASVAAQERPELSALKLREEVVGAVRAKRELPEAAFAKLRGHASPSGLKIDREADFAFAAIDIGQRLISVGEPEAAEKFFREAEKSLTQAIKITSDSAVRDKAAFLQRLAFVRSKFLGKPALALENLEAAQVLDPESDSIKQAKAQLLRENGQLHGRSRRQE